MPAPILATKLYIPSPRPDIVQRVRLIARLNEGRKLILVSAPAGFGKTTLISEWLATLTPARAAWLSLDEGDSDFARFLRYFIAAAQTLAPQCGEAVLSMLQPLQPIDLVLTTLINELAALPERLVLVLDDYHMLDSKPIDDALTFLIDHQPSHIQLVITTREDPQLPLARLRVRGQLTELRAADLRFTPDEAADFLNRVMGLNLSADHIVALENRTEGWIAGLQLAAISMQGREDAAQFIGSFTGSHHFVLDYLIEEVLHQQSTEVLSFLLHTSMLDRLCGSLCEAVLLTPAGSGQMTLEFLERANLFIVPLDHERQWWRYHRLFADLLRQRLHQSEPDLAEYHRRASHWFASHNFMAEAFQHAIAAQDFAWAADVAERAWQSMDDTFQTAAWLRWIKQLPEDVIGFRPVLCTQIGLAYMDAGEPAASERRLQEAEHQLASSSDKMVVVEHTLLASLPAMIALARAYNAQVQGDLSATVSYAELALRLIPEADVFRRAQAAVMLNFTHWANGNLAAARQMMIDWMNSMQQLGNHVFVVASAFAAADILIAQGCLREARRTYEQAVQLAAEVGPEAQSITAHHQLGLALLSHERGDDAAHAQHWHKAAELGQHTTLVDWAYRWQVAQARLKQDTGDFDAALDRLDEARRVYVKNPVPDLRPIAALKAHAYLKQGRLAKAQDWVRERGLSPSDDLTYLHEFEYLILARVLVAENQITSALALLDRLLQAAAHGDRSGSVIEISIVQALAHQAQSNLPAALTALDRALTLAEPEGYVRTFVSEGEPLRLLLEKMKDEGGRLKDYLRKLLAAFDLRPDSLPSALSLQPLVEPLSPRELEVLCLIEQGLSNQAIADRLFLAVSTIKGYTRTLFDKLQVQRRTEAVVRARELGLL